MCSRSASASVRTSGGMFLPIRFSSASGGRRTASGDRITERSMTGDVPRPLAEWREFDGKDAESVKEIATKSAVLGHPSQVPIGRGHQSKVHANSPRAAKSLEFLLL